MFDPLKLLAKLPKRTYWKTDEIAEATGLIVQSIKRVALRYSIGRIMGSRGRGTRIYEPMDIFELCKHLQGPANHGRHPSVKRAHAEFVERQRVKYLSSQGKKPR